MRFELEPYNLDANDEDILSDLRLVASKLGRSSLTWKAYQKHGRFGTETVRRRLGSWNNALARAGLPISKRWRVTLPELYDNLVTVWIKLGRQPRRTDLTPEISQFSGSTYEQRFGSWHKALESFVTYMNEIDNSEASSFSQFPEQTTKRTPRQPSLRLSFRVMKRDNFKCVCCGKAPATHAGIDLHVDHIKPWSKGGVTTFENLQTLCSNCNYGKGNLE